MPPRILYKSNPSFVISESDSARECSPSTNEKPNNPTTSFSALYQGILAENVLNGKNFPVTGPQSLDSQSNTYPPTHFLLSSYYHSINANSDLEITMPTLNLGPNTFYYELHGKGKPVVFIAGLGGDHTYWVPVLDQFAAHYQVLIFDNRGTGQTQDNETTVTVDMMADDTINIIQALNLETPHLIGHSLGGAIGQVIAKNNPQTISSLVLCNTLMKFNSAGGKVFNGILELYKQKKSPSIIMEQLAPHIFSKKFLTPAFMRFLREITTNNPYPQTLRGFEKQLSSIYSFDSQNWIQEIHSPTLVIGSTEDTITPVADSKEIAEKIANAKLYITNTGHASFAENPTLFYQVINQFFETK